MDRHDSYFLGGHGRFIYFTLVRSITQFVSQLFPPSGEKACSQCAELAVMCDQVKRTLMGFPRKVSSPSKMPTPFSKLPITGGPIVCGSRPSSHQIAQCLRLGVVAADAHGAIGIARQADEVVVHGAVAVHRHPHLAGSFELHPFVAVGEAIFQAAMMDAPFADEEIEIMRVVGHGGFCGCWSGGRCGSA